MKGKKTGGRTKGTPNKSTAELRDLAQSYAPEAMKELFRLATNAESEQARVAAITQILDRGYGKPTQVLAGDAENPLTITTVERVIVDAAKGANATD